MKYDVCVTDCDTKHGFAIGRYLKKRGLKVLLQYRNTMNPFYYTIQNKDKYVGDIKNNDNIEKFIDFIRNNKTEVLIPVSNAAVQKVSEHSEQLGRLTKTVLPHPESLRIAQDKRKTFRYAEKLGVQCPCTIYDTSDLARVQNELDEFSFPAVIKYVNVGETGVLYCSNKKQVIEILQEYSSYHNNPPIVQEYIRGIGVGFYAIYNNGECQNYFMHRRIHEYPVTGGASSFAMSYCNEKVKESGLKILDSLQWHGVAMIEFKLTDNNDVYLIEINPKFWGSYELAEKCGISFAYDYYQTALGKTVQKKDYDKSIAFRWLFNDIMYYRDKLLSGYRRSSNIQEKPKYVYNDLYFDEPFIMTARMFDTIIRLFVKKINPHSRP